MKRLFFLAIILTALMACKSKKTVAEAPKQVKEETGKVADDDSHISLQSSVFPDSAVARIQRTACFGRCPIYRLTIYKSGFVLFEGDKWVENEGTFFAITDQSRMDQLFKKAEFIGYFELNNEYDSKNVTDLPSTITTLRLDDTVKEIVNRYQGPRELGEFELLFDELYLKLDWKPYSKD